jgi:hypothetical protein
VRRKRGSLKRERSGWGRKFQEACDSNERAVRDLPWSEFQTTVHIENIEVYRVKCPECGVRVEKVPLLPSKAPFSKRFEDAVGNARKCLGKAGGAAVWSGGEHRTGDRPALSGALGGQPALRQIGIDGIQWDSYRQEAEVSKGGRQSGQRRTAVVGRERKKETLDKFFREEPGLRQRRRVEAACVDIWEPMTNFALCSVPTRLSMRCGARGSSVRVAAAETW